MPQLARRREPVNIVAWAHEEFAGEHVVLLGAVVIAHSREVRVAMLAATRCLRAHPHRAAQLLHISPTGHIWSPGNARAVLARIPVRGMLERREDRSARLRPWGR